MTIVALYELGSHQVTRCIGCCGQPESVAMKLCSVAVGDMTLNVYLTGSQAAALAKALLQAAHDLESQAAATEHHRQQHQFVDALMNLEPPGSQTTPGASSHNPAATAALEAPGCPSERTP